MRTVTTIAATAALAWLPASIPAAAQETTADEALEDLQVERSEYRERYMAEAFERIEAGTASWDMPDDRAKAFLRQAAGPRPAAELDAFADQVVAMALDATLPEHVRSNARSVLSAAANLHPSVEGTPYPRAFDLLVQVYESGYDHALSTIMRVDSVRGLAYVRELFERSERPPLCHRGGGYEPLEEPPECEGYSFRRDARPTPWCKAGGYLFGGIVAEAWERTPGGKRHRGDGYPAPFPKGLPEHVEDWHRRCR